MKEFKQRENNFDLLRIVCTFSVVMLHVSGSFLRYDTGHVPMNCSILVMFLNCVTRVAVPCFFMLSGGFVLADERNGNYRYFYKKSIKNIGITSAIFCILYTVYNVAKLNAGVFIFNKYATNYVLPGMFSIVENLLTGRPFGHLWYLFTLVGLYLAAPFVIRLAAALDTRGGVNLYGKITTIFLFLASISYITSEHKLMWDIGWQFCFLSLFMMGYKLRRWGKVKQNNKMALLLIVSGVAVNAMLAYINYLRGLYGLPVDVIQLQKNPFSYAPLAPIEVIASCLTFAGFAAMKVRKNMSRFSGYTFLIYLIHAGIWDVIRTLMGDRIIGNQADGAVAVVAISSMVFFVSLLVGIIYQTIANKLYRKMYKA